ncbi:GntR family transcriptional regulator [Phaeobacter sp. C3_T13_0]|uniref:GntR family transcriptional regulator n=1 Tax=Phaeobacter cretensis TaxID=3342641 RepID=UPI0039BCD3E1
MKLKSVDISKTASASAIVFDALRKAIIEGDLKEGEPLRQDEIAQMFNTSRIPVREAISRLEEQGLVKTQRYKGAVVSSLSAQEAQEIFDFRAVLEPEVIRRAVPRMSPAALSKAKDCLEAFSQSEDPMTWGDLNRDFHSTLYRESGLHYHMDVIDNAMDRVDSYLRAQLVLSDGNERANSEHLAIWNACVSGDADLAASLTRDHITGACETLLLTLKELG